MKQVAVIGFIVLLFAGVLIGLSYGFGWIGVHQTKTIGKAQENARREVFEQTQSFVDGKRQSALKYYREYLRADSGQKPAIRNIVAHEFATFDEDQYLSGEIRSFIRDCKYKVLKE